MSSHKSFLLHLGKSENGSEACRTKHYAQLRQVDPSAVYCDLSSQCIKTLSDHCWYVNENRWAGLLLIHLPSGSATEQTFQQLLFPAAAWLASVRRLSLSDGDFNENPLLNALSLAESVCERDGTTLILVEDEILVDAAAMALSAVADRFEQNLFIVSADDVSEEFIQTARTQQEYRFATGQDAVFRRIGLDSESRATCELVPYTQYRSWAEQELRSQSALNAFFQLCESVLGLRLTANKIALRTLPSTVQIAMGVLRTCRQVANWNLEGEAIQCSILIGPNDDAIQEIEGIGEGFTLENPIRWSLEYESEIRKCVEVAHVSGLFLTVSLESGAVGQLRRLNTRQESGERSRHLVFPAITRNAPNCAIVHFAERLIEVYSRGRLLLWHDGFQWNVRPYLAIRRVLSDFLSDADDDANKKEVDIQRLIAAIATILDRQDSSILVLLGDHQDALNRYASEELRRGIALSPQSCDEPFARNPLDLIVSVLHLDGAHVIDKHGRLVGFARQINIPTEEFERVVDEETLALGSGTKNAIVLSAMLRQSYVIKTSSSGYVKVFFQGKEYRPLR